MDPLLICAVLGAALTAPLAAGQTCQGATFETCDHKLYNAETRDYKKTPAVKCADRCINRRYWCSVMEATSDLFANPEEFCANDENFKFENCLSVKFSKEFEGKTVDYLWSSVETHWEIAEMYCQSQGYNLLSFHSQAEVDYLKKEMGKAISSTKSFVEGKNFTDLIGQHCWEKEFADVKFWTGIFHDRDASTWNYTDGKVVSEVVLDAFSDLKTVTDEATTKDKKRITWSPKKFFGYDVFNRQVYVPGKPKIQILCSKSNVSEPKKYHHSGGTGFKSCITGFDCASGPCHVGTMLSGKYQKVLDGRESCDGKEDEKFSSFPHVKVPTTDETRQYIFFPVKRTRAEIEKFCKANSLKNPSVRSEEDKKTLLGLAEEYMKQKAGKDLGTLSRDLAEPEWALGLVVRKNGKWDDGSSPSALKTDITDWDNVVKSPSSDIKIALKSTGRFSMNSEPGEEYYVVCQGDHSGSSGRGVGTSGASRPALLLALVMALLLRL